MYSRLYRKMKLLIVTAILATLLIVQAFGDVIWTPMDSFFNQHYDKCEYVGRSFIASGADGYVTVYSSPDNMKEIDRVRNDSVLYVSYTYYVRGRQLGVIEYQTTQDGYAEPSYSGSGETGWIDMSQLLLKYDSKSFAEEHESQFKPYAGEFDSGKYSQGVIFWTYPGSGEIKYEDVQIEGSLNIEHTYTDADGRLWGYVSSNYFIRACWVCISDPLSKDLPVVPVENKSPAITDPKQGWGAVCTLVIIVVLATVVLLWVFMRRKK